MNNLRCTTRGHKTCRFQWVLDRFVPPRGFVTGDTDSARNPARFIPPSVSGNGRTAYNQEHMRKYLYIAFSILINCSVFGQVDSQTDSVSFDKITCRFKETKGWNIFSGELKDSIDTTFYIRQKTLMFRLVKIRLHLKLFIQ